MKVYGLLIELLSLIEVLFEDMDEMELLVKLFNDEKAFEMINRFLESGLKMKIPA